MKVFDKIKRKIKWMFYDIVTIGRERRLMKKYPDYRGETAYDNGEYIFVWGIKSADNLGDHPACLYTINDIDIRYSRRNKNYVLGIETAYMFDSKDLEVAYLESLLDNFSRYMGESGLSTDEPYRFLMSAPQSPFEGETIQELYTNFKIFVNGYRYTYSTKA